ncbi:MAG: hypothetical protein CBC38_05605 [Gammaproteobacteria bacterium TMED78]|nr:MAG: hypothetical protein CBC38_05605 [Gammaproteobacteria bacterium TMED78]
MSKILIFFMAILLITIQLFFWLSDGGIREAWNLEKEVELRFDKNQELEERNSSLEAEVFDLKQGLSAIEERARTDLGMISQEETYYHIIDE